MSQMSSIRKAATLVLLAPTETGFKVLFCMRSSTMKFLPNLHVFPGGVVESFDETGPISPSTTTVHCSAHVTGETMDNRNAALRETFEETGIFLAKSALQQSGSCLKTPESMSPAVQLANLATLRSQSSKNPQTYYDYMTENQLFLDTANVFPWSRWYFKLNFFRVYCLKFDRNRKYILELKVLFEICYTSQVQL